MEVSKSRHQSPIMRMNAATWRPPACQWPDIAATVDLNHISECAGLCNGSYYLPAA